MASPSPWRHAPCYTIAMTQIGFYHLPLEQALPRLLEKAYLMASS